MIDDSSIKYKCVDSRDLFLLTEGRLSIGERRKILAHLIACPECMRKFVTDFDVFKKVPINALDPGLNHHMEWFRL